MHVMAYALSMDPYDYSNTIQKAASLARGDRLTALQTICETQKEVSTRKLERLIDKLWDGDRMTAWHLKALADKIKGEQ